MTRSRSKNELRQHAAGLACIGLPPRSHASVAVTAREIVDEAWQGGRDEAGRELAGILGRLIDDGALRNPAVRNALGPLIALVPGSRSPRLEAARSEAVSFIMTSQKDPDRVTGVRESPGATAEETGPGWHTGEPVSAAIVRVKSGYPWTPPDRITGVREVSPAEAARLLAEFGTAYPRMTAPGPQDHPLPLADIDSEPEADAAQQRAVMTDRDRYRDEADARAAGLGDDPG
jgi:hypothetical protein